MEKVKENSLDNYHKPFAKRLRELLDGVNSPLERKVNQKELADNIGVTRQVISQYCNGITSPNVDTLRSISEFFHVSSDYLIGISNTPTVDIADKAIHDITGLTDPAIKTIKLWNDHIENSSSHKYALEGYALEEGCRDTLNYLLSNTNGKKILEQMSCFLFCDYTSENGTKDTVQLYNNRYGYYHNLDIKLIKSGFLANIQSLLIKSEEEINS